MQKKIAGKVTRKQLEVDFVCNMGSVRYYIQSAYSLPDETKHIQEINRLEGFDLPFKKIVITKDIVQPHYDEYGNSYNQYLRFPSIRIALKKQCITTLVKVVHSEVVDTNVEADMVH